MSTYIENRIKYEHIMHVIIKLLQTLSHGKHMYIKCQGNEIHIEVIEHCFNSAIFNLNFPTFS